MFVWVGSQSNDEERARGLKTAQDFIAAATDGRDQDGPIVVIAAGNEPDMFTSYFLPWDPEYTTKHTFKDPYQARLDAAKEANKEVVERRLVQLKARSAAEPPAAPVEEKKPEWAKAKADEPPPAATPAPAPAPVKAAASSGLKFTPEHVKSGLPDGVDPTQKETYLAEGVFRELFKMEPAAFAALPKWKRDEQKKKVGLF